MNKLRLVGACLLLLVLTACANAQWRMVPGGNGPDLPDKRYDYSSYVALANSSHPYYTGVVNGVSHTAEIVDGSKCAINVKRLSEMRARVYSGELVSQTTSQATLAWMAHHIVNGVDVGWCWAILPPGSEVYVKRDLLAMRLYTDDVNNWKKEWWQLVGNAYCGNDLTGLTCIKHGTQAGGIHTIQGPPGLERPGHNVYLWVDTYHPSAPTPCLQPCPQPNLPVVSYPSKWRGEQNLSGQRFEYIPGPSMGFWFTRSPSGSLQQTTTPPGCPGGPPTLPGPGNPVIPPPSTPPNDPITEGPRPDPTDPNPGPIGGKPSGPPTGGGTTVPVTRG